mmetsp:Transcript_16223/g.21237  ORF Transcript_16223/g.21237 Transcript_16223/m.21237 type:complete len:97 (+) Transcript_16223:561-851(+)
MTRRGQTRSHITLPIQLKIFVIPLKFCRVYNETRTTREKIFLFANTVACRSKLHRFQKCYFLFKEGLSRGYKVCFGSSSILIFVTSRVVLVPDDML